MSEELKIVNLTPHQICLYEKGEEDTAVDPYNYLRILLPHKEPIRLEAEEQTQLDSTVIAGVTMSVVSPPSFKKEINWPELDCDVVLVSMPVGQMVQSNPDCAPPYQVWGPDTGPEHVVRDGGRIAGTTRFIRYH